LNCAARKTIYTLEIDMCRPAQWTNGKRTLLSVDRMKQWILRPCRTSRCPRRFLLDTFW